MASIDNATSINTSSFRSSNFLCVKRSWDQEAWGTLLQVNNNISQPLIFGALVEGKQATLFGEGEEGKRHQMVRGVPCILRVQKSKEFPRGLGSVRPVWSAMWGSSLSTVTLWSHLRRIVSISCWYYLEPKHCLRCCSIAGFHVPGLGFLWQNHTLHRCVVSWLFTFG